MGNPDIEAVIFDMDGLLLDSERVIVDAAMEAARNLEVPLDRDLFLRFIGKTWSATESLLRKAVGPERAPAVLEEWWKVSEARIAADGIPLKSGAAEIVHMLASRSVPAAVATSTYRERALARLDAARLLGHLNAVAAGDEIRNGKPAPDIFLLAAERLGADPERCLVLEDSEPGVRGAAAAGMPVIIVPDLVAPSSEVAARAARVCRSLSEAQAFLEGLLPPADF